MNCVKKRWMGYALGLAILAAPGAMAVEPVLHRCEAECFLILDGEAYSLGLVITESLDSRRAASEELFAGCESDEESTRALLKLKSVRSTRSDRVVRVGTRWEWYRRQERWFFVSDRGTELEYQPATERNSCRSIPVSDLPPVTEIGGRPVGG